MLVLLNGDNLNKMNNQDQQKNQEIELEKLLKKNLAISQEVLSISKYVKKYIFWKKIIGIAKIVIIVVPIVLGIIYLPPMIEDAVENINSNLNNPLSSIINSNCENEQ
ncbi:hypothetical protein K9M50_02475 [Patescibacteria group bacterium]|nr:hypothetical protein [Patescibacteria group bacterium]